MKKIFYYLIFLIVSFSSCSQNIGRNTIRLIPKNYVGPVLIIFDQKEGQPIEYENENRIYKIPFNGILKTSFSANYGIQSHEFYYVDEKGSRTKIPFIRINEIDSISKIDSTLIYAYRELTLSKVEKYDPDTKELLYTKPPRRSFYIGKITDIKKSYLDQQNFILSNQVENKEN